jgi:hypothetical protein
MTLVFLEGVVGAVREPPLQLLVSFKYLVTENRKSPYLAFTLSLG